jgi:hypothetical protein
MSIRCRRAAGSPVRCRSKASRASISRSMVSVRSCKSRWHRGHLYRCAALPPPADLDSAARSRCGPNPRSVITRRSANSCVCHPGPLRACLHTTRTNRGLPGRLIVMPGPTALTYLPNSAGRRAPRQPRYQARALARAPLPCRLRRCLGLRTAEEPLHLRRLRNMDPSGRSGHAGLSVRPRRLDRSACTRGQRRARRDGSRRVAQHSCRSDYLDLNDGSAR